MYNRQRISRGAGTAIAVWAIVGLVIMSTGVAFALPMGGIGGFLISAQQTTAEESVLYPGTASTDYGGSAFAGDDAGEYPATVVELDEAQLQAVDIIKTINDSDVNAPLGGNIQIRVRTASIESPGVLLKTSGIQSQGVTFNGFNTINQPADDDVAQRFQVAAEDSAQLNMSLIRAHYLVASQVDLGTTSVYTCYDVDADGEFDYGPGADEGDLELYCNYPQDFVYPSATGA